MRVLLRHVNSTVGKFLSRAGLFLSNQLKRLLDSKFLRWSLGANQLSCPKSGLTDLTVLTIGSAPSKQWRSASEAFRAGHYKDLTEAGNRAIKVSGTQGRESGFRNPENFCFSVESGIQLKESEIPLIIGIQNP